MYCRAINTEDYSVNTKLTCAVQSCTPKQVCGRRTVQRPGSRGNGGYELADVFLNGCVDSNTLGCEDVELSEEEECFCDTDFCNSAFLANVNILTVVFSVTFASMVAAVFH